MAAPVTMGIDFSTRRALIACHHTVEEVKSFIGLDSLCYLSLSGMLEATGLEENGFCLACFDGKYPVQPGEGFSKFESSITPFPLSFLIGQLCVATKD